MPFFHKKNIHKINLLKYQLIDTITVSTKSITKTFIVFFYMGKYKITILKFRKLNFSLTPC